MKPKDKAKLSALEQNIKFHRDELEKLEAKKRDQIMGESYSLLQKFMSAVEHAGINNLYYRLEEIEEEFFFDFIDESYDKDEDWGEEVWG